ncbi:MAG: hypothetical protein H7334_08275 [Ferruginibacter sp.]|nr:hypothetical protein [Ferruginibacter sp.]
MKKILLAFLAISIAIISCKKDKSIPASATTDNYMPFTANSTWQYKTVNNLMVNNDSVIYTVTSSNRDSTINSKIYHVLTTTNGPNQYRNITGNDYYTFQALPQALGGSAVETIYLKDNIAANGNWSQLYNITASGLPVTINLLNTIAEKGISRTVNGIAYTDVIHVTTTLSVSLLGSPLPTGAVITDIQNYYAKKVGMIESKNKISINFTGITNNIDQLTTLQKADIK